MSMVQFITQPPGAGRFETCPCVIIGSLHSEYRGLRSVAKETAVLMSIDFSKRRQKAVSMFSGA